MKLCNKNVSNPCVSKLTLITQKKEKEKKERGIIITHSYRHGENEPTCGEGGTLSLVGRGMVGSRVVLYPGPKFCI